MDYTDPLFCEMVKHARDQGWSDAKLMRECGESAQSFRHWSIRGVPQRKRVALATQFQIPLHFAIPELKERDSGAPQSQLNWWSKLEWGAGELSEGQSALWTSILSKLPQVPDEQANALAVLLNGIAQKDDTRQ